MGKRLPLYRRSQKAALLTGRTVAPSYHVPPPLSSMTGMPPPTSHGCLRGPGSPKSHRAPGVAETWLPANMAQETSGHQWLWCHPPHPHRQPPRNLRPLARPASISRPHGHLPRSIYTSHFYYLQVFSDLCRATPHWKAWPLQFPYLFSTTNWLFPCETWFVGH